MRDSIRFLSSASLTKMQNRLKTTYKLGGPKIITK
jgi:hypothetical protein